MQKFNTLCISALFVIGCGKPAGQHIGTAPTTISEKALHITGNGALHVCAHLEDGRIKCWGHNKKDQCNLTRARNIKGKYYDVSNAKFHKIAAGYSHTCGILNEKDLDGIPVCFGKEGKWLDVPHEKIKDISVRGYLTCFIKENAELRCVGNEILALTKAKTQKVIEAKDLINHGITNNSENKDFSKKRFANVKANSEKICGKDADDELIFCMGSNLKGTGESIPVGVVDYYPDNGSITFILQDNKLFFLGTGTIFFKKIHNLSKPESLKYKKLFNDRFFLTASGNRYDDGTDLPENTLISTCGALEEHVLDATLAVSSSSKSHRPVSCVVKGNHKVKCEIPQFFLVPDGIAELESPIIKNIPKEIAFY